jgi:hypothetical protein
MLTLATIAEHWMKKFIEGAIKYAPAKVEMRAIAAPVTGSGFKVILNSGRKDRLDKKAA